MPLLTGAEASVFFRAWLRTPLGIGSLLPSSNTMGRAFAALLDFDRPGHVLELGSGTGAISQGLLDAGLPAERLIMVEREPEMASYLRHRFPAACIVEADARAVGSLVQDFRAGDLIAVVSSLPIVWFPLEDQALVMNACLDVLGEGGSFLQMTNLPMSPVPMEKLGLAGVRAKYVWQNLPPSFIWRYWRPSML